MDIPISRPTRRTRPLLLGGAALLLLGLVAGLARLKPAAPSADRQSILVGTVKRGPMVFQVRGTGTLQPVEVRWITSATAGRVERVAVLPGTAVKAGDVILELANPELQQATQDAEWQLKAAEADLLGARARQENRRVGRDDELSAPSEGGFGQESRQLQLARRGECGLRFV